MDLVKEEHGDGEEGESDDGGVEVSGGTWVVFGRVSHG